MIMKIICREKKETACSVGYVQRSWKLYSTFVHFFFRYRILKAKFISTTWGYSWLVRFSGWPAKCKRMQALQSRIPAKAANCTFRHHFVPSRKVDVPFSHGSKKKTPLCKVHYKVLLCKARLYYIALSLFPFKLYEHSIRRSQPFATIASQPARSGAGLPRSLLFKVKTSDALKRLYIEKSTYHKLCLRKDWFDSYCWKLNK